MASDATARSGDGRTPPSDHDSGEVLHGTMQMLVLKLLELQPMHGYGIQQRIEQVTRGALRVNPGSLFPALHRMERGGLLMAEWGRSANGRRAKFYRLTQLGRRRLHVEKATWRRAATAVERVLAT